MKRELTKDQKEDLREMCARIPPEDVDCLHVYNKSEDLFVISLDQDTLPVIMTYLEMVAEKMNG